MKEKKKKYFYTGDYIFLIDTAKFEYIGNMFHIASGDTTNFSGRVIDDEKQVVYNADTMSLTVQDYNRDVVFPMQDKYIQDLIDAGKIFIME